MKLAAGLRMGIYEDLLLTSQISIQLVRPPNYRMVYTLVTAVISFTVWSCLSFKSYIKTYRKYTSCHLELLLFTVHANLLPRADSEPLFQSSSQKTTLAQRVVFVGVFESADMMFSFSHWMAKHFVIHTYASNGLPRLRIFESNLILG